MNFISIKDFSKLEIKHILNDAKELHDLEPRKRITQLGGKIMASLFFEPSTRTRLSFTSAAYKLGCRVLGFDNPDVSSIRKGESLRDTIIAVSAYSDIIVMRHFLDGAARFAEEVTNTPIINAGDGANEHPSQTLLDLYTIREELGDLENKKIAFVGDLKYGRTVHSLVNALKMFNGEFYFIAPDIIQIPDYILKELDKANIKYHIHSDYKEILKEIDCLYMTRIQRERFNNMEEYEKVKNVYQISKKDIEGKCNENMIVMHPLPRVDEINIDLDDTKYAKYFIQAKNGVPIRMAMLINAEIERWGDNGIPKPEIIYSNTPLCKNQKCITNFEKTKNAIIKTDNGNYCYYCGKEIL